VTTRRAVLAALVAALAACGLKGDPVAPTPAGGVATPRADEPLPPPAEALAGTGPEG
jgi:hypothetical protein